MKRLLLLLLCGAAPLGAQVPDAPAPAPSHAQPAAPASSSAPSSSSSKTGQPSFLGKDVPVLNPGNEVLTWDGKNWNITNQRFFQARFEKYLNAAEETTGEDLQYQKILRAILTKLAPENDSRTATLEAWKLLPQASNFSIDARLCDALADAVYSSWLSMRAQDRLVAANQELQNQRKQYEWAAQHTDSITFHPSGKSSAAKEAKEAKDQEKRMAPYVQRLVEVNARIVANTTKREITEVQARIEFQALIAQFFLQRRFQHVVMATRFYRHIFNDGGTTLGKSKSGKPDKGSKSGNNASMTELYTKETGMPLTVGVVDSLANEAMRDVKEGVEAYHFLLQKNEIESATKRLSEAFLVGEYMPEIRTLQRDKKRQALEFTQKGNRLISALDVRDYALAETLVKELETIAKDFDASQPRAAIETARTVSAMHLAKAKNAAVSGDRTTLENELREATTLWPRNPALAEVAGMIFSHADVQGKALADLEQLTSQHNYRQIYEDKGRFIAATAFDPQRQKQLEAALMNLQQIETVIGRSTEIAKRGDTNGAWEGVERASKQFPDDTKLNQLRANLTTEASDFVHCIRNAQQLEAKGQTGSSLAWYLKAQKVYPPSEFAQEGIQRLVQKLLPGS
ncbi:MAG: hypothetical protein NTZ46_04870 [Verrucomicrobia bacterium]|nr:hypothetical protein [Verrucomicrobiota bacterium]